MVWTNRDKLTGQTLIHDLENKKCIP